MDEADATGVRLLDQRYRLVEPLGAGGMSVVWRGYDEILGRQVAVKVLAPRLATDRAFRRRLRAEARSVARLCHPNITNVYDYGEAAEGDLTLPYVVMELVEGRTLADHLCGGKRLAWRDAVAVVAQVAAALSAAHARGVVHRDVTPGNVMLTATGVKVVDFGISALTGGRDTDPDGQLLGTPGYVAPERLGSGTVAPAADVYAAGLLLYRSLTGAAPWMVEGATDLLRAHLYREPAPLPTTIGVPAEVASLCLRCLAKSPQERPSSAELAGVLAEAAGIVVAVPPGASADDKGLSEAGTTILPWSVTQPVTSAGPIRPARRSGAGGSWTQPTAPGRLSAVSAPGRLSALTAPGRLRRTAEVAAVAVGLVAATGAVWAASSRGQASGEDQARSAAEMSVAARPDCRVEYALRSDSGSRFDAELTLTNLAAQPAEDWTLTFSFPADQQLAEGSPGSWEQHGTEVTVRSPAGASLAAGQSVTMDLSGAYARLNALPMEFRLDGGPCVARVAAAPGSTGPAAGTSTGPAATPTDPERPTGRTAGGGPARPAGQGGVARSDTGSESGPGLKPSQSKGKDKGKGKGKDDKDDKDDKPTKSPRG